MRKFSKREISFETSAENARTKKGFLRQNIISWRLYVLYYSPPCCRKEAKWHLAMILSVLFLVFYYILNTDEIPGFLVLLKNRIFTARSEHIIFIFHM